MDLRFPAPVNFREVHPGKTTLPPGQYLVKHKQQRHFQGSTGLWPHNCLPGLLKRYDRSGPAADDNKI